MFQEAIFWNDECGAVWRIQEEAEVQKVREHARKWIARLTESTHDKDCANASSGELYIDEMIWGIGCV